MRSLNKLAVLVEVALLDTFGLSTLILASGDGRSNGSTVHTDRDY